MLKTYDIQEIDKVAREVWKEGQHVKTWAFDAAMGAGKTTLIHALCDFLQVQGAVSSPTFALMNEYSSPVAGTIFHMDWYRLKDETEAINAGMEDAILSSNYCFVEWPGKASGILPEQVFHVRIDLAGETTRQISTSTGAFPEKD